MLENDITKTGPVGLKGLKRTTNNSVDLGIEPRSIPLNLPTYTGVGETFDVMSSSGDYGTSRYDIEGAIAPEVVFDTESSRYANQSNLQRIGNALINNSIIAGTTAMQGLVGLPVGILNAVAKKDWSELWNNEANQKIYELQQEGISNFKINRPSDYQDKSVWEKMGTNIFWADLIQNLGYAEGMIVPGTAISKAFSWAPKVAQLMAGSLYGALTEASMEAIGAKEDKIMYETSLAEQEFSRLMSIPNLDSDEVDYLQSSYKDTIENIKEDAIKSGNFVFGYNTALLTLSNAIQWGKLFTRGNKFSRRAQLVKDRSKGITATPKGLDIDSKTIATAKNIGRRFANASTEMLEEAGQTVGTMAADLNINFNTFNESIYNPEYRELASNNLSSILKALSDAVNDPEVAESAAMGFLTGLIGIPTLQNPKTSDGYRSPIKFEGGISEFIEEQNNYNNKVKRVNEINQRLQDLKFKEYYDGIVRDMQFQDKGNIALEIGDTFNFNNYDHARIISDVIMFDNVGHLDMLKDMIDKSSNFTDEDINDIIQSTSENGNGPFMTNGNPMSVTEVREKIKENASNIKNVIDNYVLDRDSIESELGNELSKEALESIIFAKSQIRNWQGRQNNIINELYEKINTEDSKSDFILNLKSGNIKQYKKLIEESFVIDEAVDLISKLEDAVKINNNIVKYSTKIKEFWESPKKANEDADRNKEKASQNLKNKKVSKVKNRLNSARTVGELRNIISNEQDPNLESALEELEKENNATVKELKSINLETSNIVDEILKSKEDTQAIQDAVTLINNASNIVNSVAQLKDLQSELYNDVSLLGENDSNKALERITKARVVLQQALNDSTKETSDTDSVVMDMEIPDDIGSMEIDMPDSPLDNSETGNSGVSKAKSVNSTAIKEIEQQEIKDSNSIPADYSSEEDIKDESDIDIDDLTSRDKDVWNPSISEFHRSSLKKGQFISTAKADSRFKDVWKYLYDNNAFEFVNKGNLKVGDTLYFGLVLDNDSQWIKDSIFIYVKTDVGYQVLNTLYLSREEEGFKQAILEEYNEAKKQEGQTQFISSYTSKVASLKTGVTQQGNTLIPLETSIEGTEITPKNMVLSVIRGVKKETGNFKDSNNEIGLPDNIGKKNGWTYIEIPNAKRGSSNGRTAIPVFVTDYGKQNSNFENTQINKRIQNAIRGIATATNYEELKQSFGKLQKDLTTKKLALFLTPEGNIRINERLFDSEGKPVINSDGKEAQKPNTIFKTNRGGSPKSVETIIEEIDNLLKSMNIRFRTNAQYINTSNYNQELLDSGILSSYLVKAEERNAWFTIEPVSLEAPRQKEILKTTELIKEEPLTSTQIESSDLDLDDLMSGFGGEIKNNAIPDNNYISLKERDDVSINTKELFEYWNKKLRKTIERDSIFDSFGEAVSHIIEPRDPEFKNSLKYIKNIIETDIRYKELKQFLSSSITNDNIKDLLNHGYSQEDINKMSSEEIQQAKQCLGF